MKKSALVFLLGIVLTAPVYAQTDQGSMMIGGGITIQSQAHQGSDATSSSFSLHPSFGYFVADNLAVGGSLEISTSKFDNGVNEGSTTSFGIGPFARYYKFTSNNRFAFYGETSLRFGSTKYDLTQGTDYTASGLSFNVAPGFSYFFTDCWAVELQLQGFRISSSDPNTDNDDDKTTTVYFGIDSFNPSGAIRFYF